VGSETPSTRDALLSPASELIRLGQSHGAAAETEHPALPAAYLLLMKLQVVELNRKDLTDAAALLSTHRLDDDDGESRSSKLRESVGRRKRWYEMPDESIT
jgi:hypothetical protein